MRVPNRAEGELAAYTSFETENRPRVFKNHKLKSYEFMIT